MFFLLKLMVVIGVILAIAYVAICLFLFFRQRQFIFLPSPNIETIPEDFNLAYEDVWLSVLTENGRVEKINGWWIPAPSFRLFSNPVKPADGVLLYLHGNRCNMGANVEEINRFHQMGFDVFSVDYQGYGRSTGGFPSEAKIYQDIDVVWDYLINQRQIDPKELFVYGHSLGGAIAIELGKRHPEIAASIVQSSFTSMLDVINTLRKYQFLPIDLILNQRFNSIAKLPELKIPILFIHGTEDQLIPSYMSEQLFAVAAEPKELFLVPGSHHNNVSEIAGKEYSEKIIRFVERIRQLIV